MAAKGHRKHKCRNCGRVRSAVGEWCLACVDKFIESKKETR